MNVRDWFDNLSERERRLVYAAGALVGVALVYLVLVLDLNFIWILGLVCLVVR